MTGIEFVVRPELTDAVLNALFTAAWPGHVESRFGPVLSHSLTWITAWRGERLIGYVNVATDGGTHAFVLNPTVHPDERRHGIGRQLVLEAAGQAKAGGVAWLHVDHEPHLDGFYAGCGFRATKAGILRLN